MTGVVPSIPPALKYRYDTSSSKHDLDGSDKSTTSVLTPLPEGGISCLNINILFERLHSITSSAE